MPKILLPIIIILSSCSPQKDFKNLGIPEIEEERILSNKDLKKVIEILNTEKFQVYNQKNHIPKSVDKLLNNWYGEKVRFASNGEKYRKGCVVTNPKMPSREIITILKSENHFVMTYNHGGRGFHQHILFTGLNKNKIAKTIWIGNASKKLMTKDEIIKELEIESNRFHTNIVCY